MAKEDNKKLPDKEEESSQQNEQDHNKPNINFGEASNQDIIDNKFLILHKAPLPEFNTKHAKAFAVSDHETGEVINELFALVYDKKLPQRIETMEKIVKIENDFFCNILAIELVNLTLNKEVNLVAVIEKPVGIPLRQYILKQGKPNLKEKIILFNILEPLNFVLRELHSHEITHGSINVDTVYIDESLKIKLNHCIGETCAVNQISLFDTADNMQASPYGKRSDPSIDYYALGVLISYCITGQHSLEAHPEQALEIKLLYGSYNLCFSKTKPAEFRDPMIGLLCDKTIERWECNKISEWLGGKKFGLVVPNEYIDAGRSLHFQGISFNNCKYLAYHLSKNWDLAKIFIKEDLFFKWIERNVDDQHRTSLLIQAQRLSSHSVIKNNFSDSDQYLCRVINVLSPESPVIIRNAASDVRTFGIFLQYGFYKDLPEYYQLIQHSLENAIFESWNDANQPTGLSFSIKDIAYYRYVATNSSKKSIGFGLERVLYDLNPNIPCQSNIVLKYYVTNISDLLNHMEDLASSGIKNVTDKHIIAFIASKLQIPSEINIRSLARFPQLGRTDNLQTVAILSIAQKRAKKADLKNLTECLSDLIHEYIEEMKSKNVREELYKILDKVSKDGNISKLLTSITDTKYLVRDQVGFAKGKTKYKRISKQLHDITNKSLIYNSGYKYGLRITVILSYILSSIIIIGLISKYNF